LKERTALILLGSGRFRIIWTSKGLKAVPHHNTVFHQVLKFVPWQKFADLVAEHGTDDRVRSFTTKQQFLALLFGQLSGAHSLREIEAVMVSHAARLYHVGGTAPARSTFADANRCRSFAVFSGLFDHLLAMLGRSTKRGLDEVVRLIDSTGLHRAGQAAQWARFSTSVCGAKAHVIFDPDLGRAVYHAVTAANVNDITAAKDMPIEAGVTYVFDLGYYDYGWWAKLHAADCRIVTRFKSNTPLKQGRDQKLEPGSQVLSDRIGFLPARQANNSKNPMSDAVREIVIETQTGKRLRLLSNDLDAPADELAALYKRRWQIELFFRLIKQTLKIRHFIGRSHNAVAIQIAVALIAHLLLCLIQQTTKVKHSMLELTRLIRSNLMHRKDITVLRPILRKPPIDSPRLTSQWQTT
jgi:hypothetical protein